MNISNPTHLRSFKGRLKTSSTSFTPKLQSGMTLIEVLIAMFVLAIGVLALLAVQLRTVSNVRESENQTTVAQITQNLIEGMLINPTLSEETDTAGDKTSRYKKSYDAYITSSSEQLKDSKQTNEFKDKMTKAQLAQAQIAQFKADLAKALPEAQVFSTICKDSSGAEPTYEKGFNAKCDGKGDTTIVKVLWLQDVEEENTAKNLNTSGHHVVYTYQSRVRD
ncbi:type IV pilus modification protein PilV [Neisseria sp. DTU_2021_1001991_1_SI_NGA_ILE_055]|uniref:type IV pilus modification protein PilV n=1 Tax=Neisseria sp. DTU_2021_1001991_1_SI_NGA_ILE_055 TaxID=3077590 RepID=UPI0028D2B364|nr:type IV pilus modification protein PilV [Neisseria sp. DTU_2021_1001991_1_SI_NGA_ILE_055]WNS84357.1 type IV pilus modification protein PilV [Neisseria sp. DTU_2021_1001991_1_SI_NGA_ILE_055]